MENGTPIRRHETIHMTPTQYAERMARQREQIPERVDELLVELGLAMTEAGVEIANAHEAETCYVHHSRVPVAVTGYGLVSPAFARGRFAKFTFLDMIAKRPSMDETEICALASLCGAEVKPPFWGNPEPFGQQVLAVIEQYGLSALFDRLDPRDAYGSRGEHYLLRPAGHDDEDNNGPRVKRWRADYKALPEVSQLMAATIVRLYNSNEKRWLVRVPNKWHAADGIQILNAAGALADWAKLVALYPGW